MARSPRPPRCLRVEHLEDRCTPAILTVFTFGDAGSGSLRDAITRANNETTNPGADTIVFGGAVRGGAFDITTSTSTLAGPTAFEITSEITIAGTGETITRTGGASYRLFYVIRAGQLTLQNLTLANGLAEGGAGGSGGGGAAGMGGAIYNQGFLYITGSTLVGNVANGSGGLAGNAGEGGGGLNGQLVTGTTGGGPNGGRPNIDDGAGVGNGGFGGGGASGGGVGGGSPGGNGGFGGGGGGGPTGLSNGGFGGFGGGGGAGGSGPTGAAGGTSVFGGGRGGGEQAVVGGDSGGGGAGLGGAIFNEGRGVFISNSTITGNTAKGGGATGNAQQGGGFGGGIFNLNGVVNLTNTTISTNTVQAGAGGVANTADGGALYNLSMNIGTGSSLTAIATVNNSILATSLGGVDLVNRQTNGTASTTGGSSIVSIAPTIAGGTVSGFTVTSPRLDPLANNGGFTRTMLPRAGSPAIDAGNNALLADQPIVSPPGGAAFGTLTTDQRGGNFVRVFNTTVDIGAFEVQPAGGGGGGGGVIGGGASGPRLTASGQTGGSAQVFTTTGSQYGGATATLAPFGNIPASVRTATADVNGDGTPDTILVTGPGTPIRVAVISGADNSTVLVAPFDPFGGNFTGGGYVAAAQLDGTGGAEFVVTPDEGGGPRVSVFSRNADGSTTVRANFLGIDDSNFRGGARAALGDVNADGVPDIIVGAGFGGGPRTAIFSGPSVMAGAPVRLVGDFFAFPGTDATNLRNGSFVAAGDVTGDGFADLIFGGGPGGAPRVFILSGALVNAGNVSGAQAAPVANFFVAGDTNDRGGAQLAAKDVDGDDRADVIVGSGAGTRGRVRVYLGANFVSGGEPGTFQDLSVFGGGALPGGVFVG